MNRRTFLKSVVGLSVAAGGVGVIPLSAQCVTSPLPVALSQSEYAATTLRVIMPAIERQFRAPSVFYREVRRG